MWDGSAVPLGENLRIAEELLEASVEANTLLEIEVGVIGGEEDGVSHEINDKLYSTVEDARATAQALGTGERGRYLTALTFGNVHGVYHPAAVHLRPEILEEIQTVIGAETGKVKPFDLVFHGGSGSSAEDIASAVASGVVKMNVDTDTQYAFTRSIAGHMLAKYDQVLKVDGGYGNKKAYDPRSWGKPAENRHGGKGCRGRADAGIGGTGHALGGAELGSTHATNTGGSRAVARLSASPRALRCRQTVQVDRGHATFAGTRAHRRRPRMWPGHRPDRLRGRGRTHRHGHRPRP